MWYFWSKGRTVLDVLRNREGGAKNEGYESVDAGAFLIDDELYDENEDFELGERSPALELDKSAEKQDELDH